MVKNIREYVIEQIDEVSGKRTESPREYIGASAIGNPCDAFAVYNLRGYESKFTPRQLRFFRLGHFIEREVVEFLSHSDIITHAVDPATGKQWEWEFYGGHVQCHADGIVVINGEKYLLEVKSMKNSSFQQTVKKGIKEAHPEYFEQAHLIMGLSDVTADDANPRLQDHIDKTLFVFYDKDNSAVDCEVILFDNLFFMAQIARIYRLLREKAQRASDKSDFWKCKYCSRRGHCHDGVPAPVSCLTCHHAMPALDGTWVCIKTVTESRRKSLPYSGLEDIYPACIEPCEEWVEYEPEDRGDA